jgi:hypothetical protein
MRIIEELDAFFEAKFPPEASWKRTKIVKDENEEIEVRLQILVRSRHLGSKVVT